MPAQQHVWTPEEVRDLQQEDRAWPRYELIDGQLIVTPAPSMSHQRAIEWLIRRLGAYLDTEPVGEAMLSPADLVLRPSTISQPDVFVVPIDEAASARNWPDVHHLLLAIEVVSPSSGRYDRGGKRTHYQAAKVAEYWIVDLDGRLIERWRPDDDHPEIIRDEMVWHPAGATTPMTFALADLFGAAIRE